MENNKIFLKNVPAFYTDNDVQSIFTDICAIKTAFIIRDKKTRKAKSYAFVKLSSSADLNKAISHANGFRIDESHILIAEEAKEKPKNEIAKTSKHSLDTQNDSPNLLVKGLKSLLTQKRLRKAASKLKELQLMVFPSPESLENAFSARLIFKSASSATEAKKVIPFYFKNLVSPGFKLSVCFMDKNAKLARLIIRNLPFNCTETMLEELFSQIGTLKEVAMVRKDTGESKGCAFIEYLSVQNSAEAMDKLNEAEIGGRKIG